jgi:hypothetical protein
MNKLKQFMLVHWDKIFELQSFFLQKTKKRKPQNLTQSQTFDGGKLRKAAEIKKDETSGTKIVLL